MVPNRVNRRHRMRRRLPTAPVYRRRRAGLVLVASGILMLFSATHSPAATAADHAQIVAAATLPQVISNIRGWIVGILAGVATLFLTVGGLRYVMAGGDPGEVEKAKGALKSAAVGYILAVLAPALVSVLQGIVGA